MPTVYWRILESGQGYSKIELWSRDDRKDLFVEDFNIFNIERLKFRIGQKLKLYNYELIQLGKDNVKIK